MTNFFSTVILLVASGGLFILQAQDGFVIYAKNGGCERELHYRTITNGDQIGEARRVVPKGPGADIWPVISYDGEWIAWARASKAYNGRYGKCDYHEFGEWNIYVARIDFGNTIPAKPIHVSNGYLPSWGDDAKTPGKPKTLYFTKYDDQTIQKTTINPNGSFTIPVEHSRCPKKMSGTNAHTQGSPDGKFILYRPRGMIVYSVEAKQEISKSFASDHPCWGPRSQYFIIKKNRAYFNTGTSVKELGPAGVGRYFFGISNDAYWDEGKLWTIGKCGRYSPSTQNGEGSIEFSEVAIDGNGKWELGKKTVVDRGCSPDIHFFPPGGPPVPLGIRGKEIRKSGLTFDTEVYVGKIGLELIINSQNLPGYSARLYDVRGKRATIINTLGSSKNIIPLNGISEGMYILKSSINKFSR